MESGFRAVLRSSGRRWAFSAAAIRGLVAALVAWGWAAGQVEGGPTGAAGSIRWQTGPALAKRLDSTSRADWSRMPLRACLEQFGQVQQVAVWLDRRVDPGRPVDLSVQDQTLRAIVEQLAEEQHLGVCVYQSVVCLGPPEAIRSLRTLAELRREDARRLSAEDAKRFFHQKAMRWPELSEPRPILADLASEGGLKILGLEQVPHDLWPAIDLPAMALVDRLTLVLSGFGLTFEIGPDGRSIRLTPSPKDVVLTRSYPGGSGAERRVAAWANLAPEARIRVEGDKIVVQGRLEDHEQIRRPSSAGKTRPGGPGPASTPAPTVDLDATRLAQVSVQESVGVVLREVSRQVGLELQIDHAALRKAGISLDQRVSVDMKDVTVDQLLKSVLEPLGMTFRRTGKLVVIRPAAKGDSTER